MKLDRNPRRSLATLFLFTAVGLSAALGGCGDDDVDDRGSAGSAGSAGEGGAASGGSSASGGASTGGASLGGASGGDAGLGGESTGGAASGGAGSGGFPEVVVSAVDDIPDQSAPDYGDNEHGVVSGGRFASWVNDWAANKPAGITGNLVVLQVVAPGQTTVRVLNSNANEGVYSYLVSANVFNQTRSNGLSSFETDLPDGPAFDAFLKKYGIDPRKDLIALTFEQQPATTNAVVQSVGRGWLFLRYWGVAKEHLAILNGSLDYNVSNYTIPTDTIAKQKYSLPPNDGTTTARHLGVDNTALVVTVEEIVAFLKQEEGAPASTDVRIIDARGGAEAYGLINSSSTGRTGCSSSATPKKCSPPFEGRLKGAASVPWTGLLDTAQNGFRFLPPSTLRQIWATQGGWTNESKEAYVYCRTNQRSTVNGIVANVILGYPTRFYETSFIEWGHLSAGPDSESEPNKSVLPTDHPLRTDLEELTEHAVLAEADAGAYTPGGTLGTLTQPVTWVAGPNYNPEEYVEPIVAGSWPKLDPSALDSDDSLVADRAYLRGQ